MSKKKDRIYYCVGCGKIHPKNSFYVSYSKNHANGRLPYCKDFMKKLIYNEDGDIDVENFKNILRQVDLPFLSDLYNNVIDVDGDIIGYYFRMLNSLPQYQGLTWKDGEQLEASNTIEDCQDDEESDEHEDIDVDNYLDEFEITAEMRHRWGNQYDKATIMDLEKFYNDMHMTHSIVTPQHEKALIMICKLQHQLDQHLEKGDMESFANVHKEYQKLLKSSGLRPIDKVGSDEATGMRSFSQIFEEVEKDGFIKPAPVEENQDIVDRTIQYIMNYTLRLLNQQVLSEPPIDTPKVDDTNE